MKRWQETSQVLARLVELESAGQQAALASVVRIAGSAYRRPGAKFLIAAEGSTLGGISGGCLEEDVRQTGLQVIDNQSCRLLHYETGEDDEALWGLGLGCNGAVDVFVQPTAGSAFKETSDVARELLAGTEPFALVTILGGQDGSGLQGQVLVAAGGALRSGATGNPDTDAAILQIAADHLAVGAPAVIEAAGTEVFVESFRPPSTLIVCGAGDDAIPLAGAAADAGFRVVVVDHRPAYLSAARFPDAWRLVTAQPDDEIAELPATDDTFVVLKTHNLVRDKGWARRFLETPVPYVGLLGPRARCEEIADEAPEGQRDRIFGPVGLDLGSEGPEQVGLAVVAELLAVRSGREPGHLRDRQAPIHV